MILDHFNVEFEWFTGPGYEISFGIARVFVNDEPYLIYINVYWKSVNSSRLTTYGLYSAEFLHNEMKPMSIH